MGITGLIPFLEKASTKINVKDLKGSVVAVDTYCWLHKGAYSCADKLSRGEETDLHIKFCLKYVNLLLSHNIKPILIFDGQHLPAKAQTESRRREIRENSKKRAAELLRIGRIEEARSYMRRCVDITHEMALQLIKECRKMNVDCIVAPYEADAQIAYLDKCNIVQYVITEDSDLTLFGCKKVIFKLDLAGHGLLVDSEKYHLAMNCHLERFTVDKFRYMCILSGCDYLDSLPGIGLAKACKFVLMTQETDMRKALLKIPSYLNMRHLTVTEEYITGFLKADATFKHMFVYDPFKRQMVRLNELDVFNTDIEYCSNAGQRLDDEIAFQLALGNIHPFSSKKLDDWNPDVHYAGARQSNLRYLKSIWLKDSKVHTSKPKLSNISPRNRNCAETNDESFKQSEIEIVKFYALCGDESAKKRRRNNSSGSSVENSPKNRQQSPETPIRNTHNPFAMPKRNISPSYSCNNNSSLIKSISPTKQKILSENEKSKLIKVKQIVKSRLFASNLVLLKSEDNKNSSTGEDINENSEENIEEIEHKKVPISLYLSSPETTDNCKKSSKENESQVKKSVISSNESNNVETIDVENWKTSYQSENLGKVRVRVGLNKTKKIDKDKGQSRLSMFGFQKR